MGKITRLPCPGTREISFSDIKSIRVVKGKEAYRLMYPGLTKFSDNRPASSGPPSMVITTEKGEEIVFPNNYELPEDRVKEIAEELRRLVGIG